MRILAVLKSRSHESGVRSQKKKAILTALLCLTAIAWGQGKPPAAQDDPLKLTRTEVLEGRVIGLEQGQLIERRAATIKEIQPQIDAIRAMETRIQEYTAALDKAGIEILKQRGLDPAKYAVNWKESKIEQKGATK